MLLHVDRALNEEDTLSQLITDNGRVLQIEIREPMEVSSAPLLPLPYYPPAGTHQGGRRGGPWDGPGRPWWLLGPPVARKPTVLFFLQDSTFFQCQSI